MKHLALPAPPSAAEVVLAVVPTIAWATAEIAAKADAKQAVKTVVSEPVILHVRKTAGLIVGMDVHILVSATATTTAAENRCN